VSSSPTVPPDTPSAAGTTAAGTTAAGTAAAGTAATDTTAAGDASTARPPWSPWREARADWRTGLTLLLGLAVLGVLLGVLWWGLAPRAEFRITADGPVAIGNPSEELLVADDAVFVLVVAAVGLVAGLGAWVVRRSRGVAGLVGVALGMLAAGAVAWRIGELLGPGPTSAALSRVGARVTTGLALDSLPAALAVGPFVAVLVYVMAALLARSEGLGRPATSPSSLTHTVS
jgi:hypothetical protein